MKKLLLAVGVLAALAACAAPRAPTPAASTSTASAIDGARLREHVRTLGSDAFEGRGPATPAEQRTIDYIASQFMAAGLQPGGENGGWYQSVPLLMSDITGTPSISVSTGGVATPLEQGPQIAVRSNMTGQASVNIADAPVVFAGYGVTAPECNWDDYQGLDVRGRIVVVLINDPDFDEARTTQCFGGRAMTYYGRWTYKYEEAARRGAAGLIIVHERDPASYGWETVRNSNTNTMFDIVRSNPAGAHPVLEAWIQRDVAVAMFQRAGLDFEALRTAARSNTFRAVALPNTTFSARYSVNQRQIVSHNVVARLPGSSRPNETVIYSAHWDHLGIGRPDARGDRIYNGAVDNATGVASLLELARAFAAGPRPERSVVFLAVTAEEKGLLGSTFYAANPLYPLPTTVADINMDGESVIGRARDMTTSGNGRVSLQDDLVRQLAAEGRTFTPDPLPEAGHFYRSDHFPFARVGVPAISAGPGEDLLNGGRVAGRAAAEAYTRDRYHQPADNYEDSFDFTGMVEDLTTLYRVGFGLANGRSWPEWQEGSEFRALRQQTAAERR